MYHRPGIYQSKFLKDLLQMIYLSVWKMILLLYLKKIGSDFAKHLVNKAADYDLETLVSDVFDILAQYAVGCLFIEKINLISNF